MISEAQTSELSTPPAKTGKGAIYLTTAEKVALMRPLVLRYMLPLCAVYIEEYIINSVSLSPAALAEARSLSRVSRPL
jgi:hypothetical protein